jgi:hypothetical protein
VLLDTNWKRLFEMSLSNTDYVTIRVTGIQIQKDVLNVLPIQYKDYAGTDIWFSLIQEVIQDPLTKYLRHISAGNAKRSKNTVRKKIAVAILTDITNWSTKLGVPQDNVQALTLFIRQVLDNTYIPVLRFDKDNHARFDPGMQVTAYIRECMSRQETVSFGVHFLRELRNFVVNNMGINVVSELSTKYALKSVIVQPIFAKDIDVIRDKINQCNQVIARAYEILKSTFVDRIVQPPPTTALMNQTGAYQPQVVDSIVQQLRKSLEDGSFLRNGIEPWYFPLNVSEYNATYEGETLPSMFNLYSINQADMRKLFENNTFKVYYAVGLMWVTHLIDMSQFGTNAPDKIRNISIALYSVIQLLGVTESFTDNRKIMCRLLTHLNAAMQNSGLPGIENLRHTAARYEQACKSSNDISDTAAFFQQVTAKYLELTKYI